MRSSSAAILGLVALVLALSGPSFAAPHKAKMTRYYNDYPTCSCQFGYPGRACVPAVACLSEGGRCSEACVPSPGSK